MCFVVVWHFVMRQD